jgi:amidophosphoribosyltransferase
MADKFEDECGVFGVVGHPDAVALTIRGLSALQHRGQESAGLAYRHAGTIECVKVMGTVRDLSARVQSTTSVAAIGHVRYGTCGDRSLDNAQPFVSPSAAGDVALCHNGHVVNAQHLRAMLRDDHRRGGSDSEVLARLVATHYTGDITTAIRTAFQYATPAYSVVVMTPSAVCAVRDPLGMRPLSVGHKDGATIVTSETCALDAVGATHLREVQPGEMIVSDRDRLRSLVCQEPLRMPARCVFELIYFARPDSVMFGHSVADFRMHLGERLAAEAPGRGDIVVPVPDSAVHAALGYARASGLDLSMAFVRNGHVGRSFIEPTQVARTAVVSTKLNPIRSLIHGRRVILVDDSIVRGNTCLHLVRLLRHAGAREVHLRISSPPTIASCHFGVDTPDHRELFAVGRDVAEMSRTLDADSLAFLSVEGLLATLAPVEGFCSGCFTGAYPIDVSKFTAPSHHSLTLANPQLR